MTRKQGKSVFLSILIFLFLAGSLVGAMQEENKEKKKEPTKNNETSTTTAQTAGIVRTEVGLSVLVKPVNGNLVTNDEINFETPTVEVAYVNGKPQGKALLRYKNGTRIEGEYNNGLKIGLWITYDPKGRKFKQESYKDGKEDGKFITWDENGYVYETDYKDGLFHGKQSSWDKNGKLIYEHGYKYGKAHGRYVSWYPNGAKSDEGHFNEGTGKRITWYPSGKIAFEVEFKNGKKYGKEVSWYENGRKKQEQTYNEEGKNIGKFYHWYEDGKVAFEMEYDQNGQRIYKRDYDRDGNLILENDRPVDKKKTTNSFVEIPPIYDLRNVDGVKKVTSVKNQLKTDWSNTCWAFAYTGALESHLMCVSPQPSPEPDYSEQHLADKNHGWDTNGLSVGGSLEMALAYLTRGGGPIDETDMPYDPAHSLGKQISFPPKKWIREVQRGINSLWWTSRNDEFCKEHIFTQNHGGVAGPLYFDQSIFNATGSNYYRYLLDTTIPCNHNVALVGWNNSYSRDNFSESNGHKPYIDGALIVKNSWGGEGENEWPDGDDGYFYISMDTLRYSPNTAFADVAEPIYKYTYQYDLLGHVTDIEFDTPGDTSECTYANVFAAENPLGTIDNLQAVGLVLPYDQYGQCGFNYSITVYTDLTDANNPKSGTAHSATYIGTRGEQPDGWYKYGGYYTQDIDPMPLNGGSKFSVVVKNSRDPFYHKCGYAVETRVLPSPNNPKISTLNASAKWGESFELTTSGWRDLKTVYPTATLNACIKAFSDGNFDHYWKLKEALDDPTLNVGSDNGYNLNWTRVTDSHAPGINNNDAARSNWINTGERCHMEATVAGPTGISFYWAVSSDPGNSLKLYIDQDPKAPISTWTAWKSIGGTVENPLVNWQQEQIYLPQGNHKLEWSYEKAVPATGTAGDCGWVDGFCKDVKFRFCCKTPPFCVKNTRLGKLSKSIMNGCPWGLPARL